MSATYDGAQELTAYNNVGVADMTAAGYDGDGLRQTATTSVDDSPTTQDFTWDISGSLPHLLMDSANAYIYGPGNTPIEQVNLSTGTLDYLVADPLESVRGVVDADGDLDAHTNYDAWGNPETDGGLTAYTPFGYAGGYTDPTGLIYLVGRYYNPTTGQFISVDPDVQQTNQPYAYADQDPINSLDPSGDAVMMSDGGGSTTTKKKNTAVTTVTKVIDTPAKDVPVTQTYGPVALAPVLSVSGSITISGHNASSTLAVETNGSVDVSNGGDTFNFSASNAITGSIQQGIFSYSADGVSVTTNKSEPVGQVDVDVSITATFTPPPPGSEDPFADVVNPVTAVITAIGGAVVTAERDCEASGLCEAG